MKIAIIGGLGRMGQEINKIAQSRGHETIIIDQGQGEINKDPDIFIDFSSAEATLSNLEKICSLGKPLILGTTGWYTDLEKFKKTAQKAGNTVIYSGNFSLGVNLFWKILREACMKMSSFSDAYDVAVHEFHHNKKADSPSGTASQIGNIILENFSSKQKIITDKVTEPIKKEELHVSSTRCGSIPGTHQVFFDSEFDTIELTHTARGRGGFALGAVLTAERIDQIRPGFYNLVDIFDKIFK